MEKTTIISQYGKHDGRDESRWEKAELLANIMELGIEKSFKKIIELDNQGLIETGIIWKKWDWKRL